MKTLILLTACFLGTKLADSVPVNLKSIQPRVVGGMPAELRQFPYHVLITNVRDYGSLFCGGAVISNSWVLTFASCTNDIENITLLFGATNRYNTSEEGQVSQSISGLDSEKYIIRHPNRYDLALIRLPQKLIFNEYIQAVKLPSNYPFQTFVNSPAVVSGYGRAFNAGGLYETLQYGYGNIMDLNELVAL
uniref:Peptidase S1 domain-containing protein n=1 Tax=Megaselia scalaris TaxID=36166 RepID=T1GM48_MEGSC